MVGAMSNRKLTDTSYAVLGLLDLCEPATPYQLKQAAQVSIFHFWTIPHTQLYTECARLAEAGLLEEEREETGRRRRIYRLSKEGRKAFEEWRSDPDAGLYELRDPGLLKLFCGADPAALAEALLEKHRERLAEYEQIQDQMGLPESVEVADQAGLPEGVRLALESGIGHEREYIRFWSRLREKGASA
jgi:PadR family transcriptional regulator, regulatory protein AphA